ncbi:MAG: hypothetical protein NVSMB2_02790 [Chloroflexota bacterium]
MNELTERNLVKASRAVRAACVLLDAGHPDFAASRAYYALVYTAAALLNEEDLELAEHLDLYGRVAARFARSKWIDPHILDWLDEAQRLQRLADYDAAASVSHQQARVAIEHARAFESAARHHLDSRGSAVLLRAA